MRKTTIIAPRIFDPEPFAHGVKVGHTLYSSAIPALDRKGRLVGRGDLAAQARQIYTNLSSILVAAGAAWTDVVKVNHYCSEPGGAPHQRQAMREIMDAHLSPGRYAGAEICFCPGEDGELLKVEIIAETGTEKRALGTAGGEAEGMGWAAGVRAGSRLYLSGRRSRGAGHGSADTLAQQTGAIYEAFDDLLDEAGMGWGDLVRVRQFIADGRVDFDHVRKGRGRYVPAGRFTSTSVSVPPMPPRDASDEWLIAVELEAEIGTRITLNTSATVDTPGVPHALNVGGLIHLQAAIANNDRDEILFPDDVAGQTLHALQSLEAVLDAAGCGWPDVVNSRVFCRQAAHLEIVRSLEQRRAAGARYARTELVCGFFDPAVLVEIELTAQAR
jgi:enamine deaminase RidA (YjgF/YER057c/UK114 family)